MTVTGPRGQAKHCALVDESRQTRLVARLAACPDSMLGSEPPAPRLRPLRSPLTVLRDGRKLRSNYGSEVGVPNPGFDFSGIPWAQPNQRLQVVCCCRIPAKELSLPHDLIT